MSSPKTAYLITNPATEAGTLDTLPLTENLVVLTREQLQASTLRVTANDKVCLATESVLDEVLLRLHDETRHAAVRTLKDKLAFRTLLQSLFPDFYFEHCPLDALPHAKLDPHNTYAIKPIKGCFGSGVRIVQGDAITPALIAGIRAELDKNRAVFSYNVLTPDEFLIETYLEGEEYAVDMFYDDAGEPIITNIYHHPMPANPAYLHMLYYASRRTFETVYAQAKEFLTQLNSLLHVRNLPIHSEYRMHHGQLVPIELNAFRFGGMGLGNLGYHALGVNAYDCFISNREPDWESIWQDKEDIYGYFIAYNGAHTDVTQTQPDRALLRQQFSRVILEVPFEYQTQAEIPSNSPTHNCLRH